MILTQETVTALIDYDPLTGEITRKSNRQRAGYYDKIQKKHLIRLDGKKYPTAKAIWLYMTGEWPDRITFADRDPSNISWNNLRCKDKNLQRINIDKSVIAQKVANNLRKERERAQLSQYALEYITNIKQSTISRYESGAKVPSAITIAILTKAIGCKMDDLLWGGK